jgi:hypothetical protein
LILFSQYCSKSHGGTPRQRIGYRKQRIQLRGAPIEGGSSEATIGAFRNELPHSALPEL